MKRFTEGKLKYITLFLSGGLAALALAPFYLFPVLLVSFPLFFKFLNAATGRKQSFWTGWSFGFGYFVFGLYWISNSLLVDADKFAWMIPFAVAGIPSVLAVYIGLLGICYNSISHKLSLNIKVIFFISLWVFFEFTRGWLFTGFPWNLIGYTAMFSLHFAQLASIGGVYFLSGIMIFLALLPIYYRQKKMVFSAVILILGAFVFGFIQMMDVTSVPKTAKIMIMQPNTPQSLKWEPAISKMHFLRNIEYVRSTDFNNKDIVLWPETGVPYNLNRQPWVEDILREVAPEHGIMVTGGLRSEGEGINYKVWNALYAVSRDGIYQSYDKIHLVPFGEFVPLRTIFPMINKVTPGSLDFSRGEKREVLKYKNGPSFLPLICYEVIFPEYASSEIKHDLLVNITNDGWFGNSTGPYQHLAMSQMRAIEQGIPMLRAANTGVSAVIDSNGQIVKSLGYNKYGVIEADIVLRKMRTIYASTGNYLVLGFILINLIGIIIIARKSENTLA